MAVTRADKATELQQLEAAFKGSDSAVLVDYKGMNVPQVTELRRQLRTAKASYKVVKNTIAKRALKGTAFEALDTVLRRHHCGGVHQHRPGRARQDADHVRQDHADACRSRRRVVQGRAVKPAEVAELAALPSKPELYAKLLGTLQRADGPARHGAQRRAARFDERAGRSRKETIGIVTLVTPTFFERG